MCWKLRLGALKSVKILVLLACITGTATIAETASERSKNFRLNRVQTIFLYKFTKFSNSEKAIPIKENISQIYRKNFSKIHSDPLNLAFLLYKENELKISEVKQEAKNKPLFMYSVSKTFVGMEALITSCEKNISLDEKLGQVSRLENTVYEDVTLRNALKMQSGVDASFDMVGEFNLIFEGQETPDSIRNKKMKPARNQGVKFYYNGNDTDALMAFIESSTGEKWSQRFDRHFVKPAGVESEVFWLNNVTGQALGRVGLMATPEDIIRLSLNYIDILDRNVCVRNLFEQMLINDKSGGRYGFQVWLPPNHSSNGKKFDRFQMMGFGGQRVYVERSTRTIGLVYSLGDKYLSDVSRTFWGNLK